MPDRNVVNTFDVILANTQHAMQATPEYVRQELEAHFRRHPRDRGSTFVNNLFRKVEEEHNIFLSKLAGTFSLMKEGYMAGNYDYGLSSRNIDVAIKSLGEMLKTMNAATDRYNFIDKVRQEVGVLHRILKPPEPAVPKGHEEWKLVGEGIWRNDMPAFQLIVQRIGPAYYSTVKDIDKGRVYSDATPYPTLEQAMQKATTRAAHAAFGQTTQKTAVESGYTMPSDGKQRRLF